MGLKIVANPGRTSFRKPQFLLERRLLSPTLQALKGPDGMRYDFLREQG